MTSSITSPHAPSPRHRTSSMCALHPIPSLPALPRDSNCWRHADPSRVSRSCSLQERFGRPDCTTDARDDAEPEPFRATVSLRCRRCRCDPWSRSLASLRCNLTALLWACGAGVTVLCGRMQVGACCRPAIALTSVNFFFAFRLAASAGMRRTRQGFRSGCRRRQHIRGKSVVTARRGAESA